MKYDPSSVSLFELGVLFTNDVGLGSVPVPVIIFEAVYSRAHVVDVCGIVVGGSVEVEEVSVGEVVETELGAFVGDEVLLGFDVLDALVVDTLLVEDVLVSEEDLLGEVVLPEVDEVLLLDVVLLLDAAFVLDVLFVVDVRLMVVVVFFVVDVVFFVVEAFVVEEARRSRRRVEPTAAISWCRRCRAEQSANPVSCACPSWANTPGLARRGRRSRISTSRSPSGGRSERAGAVSGVLVDSSR